MEDLGCSDNLLFMPVCSFQGFPGICDIEMQQSVKLFQTWLLTLKFL